MPLLEVPSDIIPLLHQILGTAIQHWPTTDPPQSLRAFVSTLATTLPEPSALAPTQCANDLTTSGDRTAQKRRSDTNESDDSASSDSDPPSDNALPNHMDAALTNGGPRKKPRRDGGATTGNQNMNAAKRICPPRGGTRARRGRRGRHAQNRLLGPPTAPSGGENELDGAQGSPAPQDSDGEGDEDHTPWINNGIPPSVPLRVNRIICNLASVSSPNISQRVYRLLHALHFTWPESPSYSNLSLQALANECGRLDNMVVLNSFQLMVALVQLSIRIHEMRKSKKRPSIRSLAMKCGVPQTTLEYWYSQGTRLLYVVAAGTPYILVLLAALEMKGMIMDKARGTTSDISALGFKLRNPGDDEAGILIKQFIIPAIQDIKRLASTKLSMSFTTDLPDEFEHVPFEEIQEFDQHLDAFNTNYFQLPPRCISWSNISAKSRLPTSHDSSAIAESITIRTPLILKQTTCPVKGASSRAWTEQERTYAAQASTATDLEDLTTKLSELHADGTTKPGKYVRIEPSICQGKSLLVEDDEGKLEGFLINHMLSYLPGWNSQLMAKIQALLLGEWFPDTSDREDYEFLALHYSAYNRYAEQGDGAPQDQHPNYVCKKNVAKVNHMQRVPLESQDIQDDPEEHALLVHFLDDVMNFVRLNLKHHLPEEYDRISAYCDKLPLHDKSPAYPFGGFVVNICVATHAHRDSGDKVLCVVIPFGDFDGGELAIYETGTLWALTPGSILIFPSCDLTHFNLHYKGLRGSLVLHSDKGGDKWVENFNGWAIHRPSQ